MRSIYHDPDGYLYILVNDDESWLPQFKWIRKVTCQWLSASYSGYMIEAFKHQWLDKDDDNDDDDDDDWASDTWKKMKIKEKI